MRGALAWRGVACMAVLLGLVCPRAMGQTSAAESDSKPAQEASGDPKAPDSASGATEGIAGLSRLGTMVPQTPIALLLAPSVQTELKLTESQKSKAFDLALTSGQKQRELFREMLASPEENNPQALLMARSGLRQENQEAIARILEPQQRERLEQIALQFEGPLAVSRPEVAAKLRLSSEQKESIQGIMLELQQRQRVLYVQARRQAVTLSSLDSSHFRGVRSNMAKLRDNAVREISKVLDRRQKAAFNKMLGSTFDVAKLDPEGSSAGTETAKAATDSTAPKSGTKSASRSGRRKSTRKSADSSAP